MLAAMAAEEGFVFRETLTGFKWLGNIAKVGYRVNGVGYTV
jgi:phosphoglucomutase